MPGMTGRWRSPFNPAARHLQTMFLTINSFQLDRIWAEVKRDFPAVSRDRVRDELLSDWGEPGQRWLINYGDPDHLADLVHIRLLVI